MVSLEMVVTTTVVAVGDGWNVDDNPAFTSLVDDNTNMHYHLSTSSSTHGFSLTSNHLKSSAF